MGAFVVLGSSMLACATGGNASDTTSPDEQPSTSTSGGKDAGGENTSISNDDPSSSKDSGGSPDDSGKPSDPSGDDAGNDPSSTSDAGGSPSSCATAAPSNACGVIPQCGCAASETCDVTKSDGTVACVKAGTVAQGDACDKTKICAGGLTCVGGACRPFCASPNAACAGTGLGQCFTPQIDTKGSTVPNLDVCTIKCDPRNPQTACGKNNCLWFSGNKESDCRSAGTVSNYGACSSAADCKAGYTCAPYDGSNECEKWCILGKSGECPSSATCVDTFGTSAPSSGGSKLGTCQ